jgi:hypothetical protein
VSAIDIYDQVIEQLGRGDRVAAREELKRRAVALAQTLEEQLAVDSDVQTTAEQQRDAFLAAATDPAEELLAASLPLIECGDADDYAAPRPFSTSSTEVSAKIAVDGYHGSQQSSRSPGWCGEWRRTHSLHAAWMHSSR